MSAGAFLRDKMQAQMYTVRPLSREVRGSFRLPGDPYLGQEETIDCLWKLGVVFYRDSKHSHGVVIQPEDDDETEIRDRVGWRAWKSSCVLGADWSVLRWPAMRREVLAKRGDDLTWVTWNQECVVVSMDHENVVLA